jgi:flagellar basal body rod protein FlgG
MTHILAKQDVAANNLANMNTTGFKVSQLATRTQVMIERDDEKRLHQRELQTLDAEYRRFSQGPMVSTGNSFDVALEGDGFLAVETATGTAYTRSGGLTQNAQRELTTLSGYRVLDERGMAVKLDQGDLTIASDGSLFQKGQPLAKLGLWRFGDNQKLEASGDGLYRNPEIQKNPPLASTLELRQGFLEGSNVEPVSAMVQMIAYTRNYEADQKAVQAIDQTLSKAVNEVGRVG